MFSNLWLFVAFNAGVLVVLAIDLFGLQRKAHAPSMKEAAIWTAVWVALSLGFNGLIWRWDLQDFLPFLDRFCTGGGCRFQRVFHFVRLLHIRQPDKPWHLPFGLTLLKFLIWPVLFFTVSHRCDCPFWEV
jgi:tellurite resistance protein TerC